MKLVLVIDDNDEIRENTAELLELNSYKVLTAENGKIGFEKVLASHPDVIICDVMMPGTGGEKFLKLMKEEKSTSHIPVIFFSAGSAPLEVKKGIVKGANDYLKKPFTIEELLEAIEKCFSKNGKQ